MRRAYYFEHLHGFEVKFYDSFWISDEYIYLSVFADWTTHSDYPTRQCCSLKDSSGALDFTSESDPAIGRAANQSNFFFILILSKLNIFTMKDSKV
jgi:hypothetical protein